MASSASEFKGTLSGKIGIYFLGFLITVCSLGFCFPFAANMILGWKAKNTVVSGNQLIYKGKGSVFFKIFLSCYLMFFAGEIVSAAIWFITGTVGLVLMEIVVAFLVLNSIVSCLNYMKEKTSFDKGEGGSYFDGTIGQLFWLALIPAVFLVFACICTAKVFDGEILYGLLALVLAFAACTLFINFFTAWSVEHTMTTGKGLTFKGKMLESAIFGAAATFILVTVAYQINFVLNIYMPLVVKIILTILGVSFDVVCASILSHFMEKWKIKNTETIPENSEEKNNFYVLLASKIGTLTGNAKTSFGTTYVACTDKYFEVPSVVKILVTMVFAAAIITFFYFFVA